jgi:hypothetical protein
MGSQIAPAEKCAHGGSPSPSSVEKFVEYFPEPSEKIQAFPLVNPHWFLVEILSLYLSKRSPSEERLGKHMCP